MLFNSIPFLFFLLVFFSFWPLIRNRKEIKWLWICVMSFLFYAWWDWRFLFLLIGTGSIDYYTGKAIVHFPKKKKVFLWISLISNLGSLFIFKYSYWLAGVLNELFSFFGMHTNLQEAIPEFSLVLPVGISFYTFNSLSYTIDLYRGKTKTAESLLHFMAFISFFPHLVAGPIIRARDVLQQLNRNNHISYLALINGVKTCIWGFFQKMVLADNLAVFVNARFDGPVSNGDTLSWWVCMLAFAFQIYFDFSGYSGIARGIAKCCGIHFRLNFNHPYLSSSFSEFWKRWHISLSSFFRDYVYVSLGGNRKGRLRTEINRWITMLLSGLWHGANSTFLIWGALHAAFLSIENLIQSLRFSKYPLVNWMKYPFVCTGVLVAWVFFRAPDLSSSMQILKHMFVFEMHSNSMEILQGNISFILLAAIGLEFAYAMRISRKLRLNTYLESALYAAMLAIILYFRGAEQDFIYFQF